MKSSNRLKYSSETTARHLCLPVALLQQWRFTWTPSKRLKICENVCPRCWWTQRYLQAQLAYFLSLQLLPNLRIVAQYENTNSTRCGNQWSPSGNWRINFPSSSKAPFYYKKAKTEPKCKDNKDILFFKIKGNLKFCIWVIVLQDEHAKNLKQISLASPKRKMSIAVVGDTQSHS